MLESDEIRNNNFRKITDWRAGYLFPKVSINKGHDKRLLDVFRSAQKALSIEPQRNVHRLRHFWPTLSQDLGFGESETKLLMGHKSTVMTQRYNLRDVTQLGSKMS